MSQNFSKSADMQKNNIFIFHGIDDTPETHWYPWLRQELANMGCRVIVPHFPNADQPQLKEWLSYLERYRKFMTPETIYVGHSLGATFLLRLLGNNEAAAGFFVASAFGDMEHNPYKERIKSFTEAPYDLESIRNHCKNFTVIHGDNDPYLQIETAGKKLAEALQTELITIKNGGHLNEAAGYTRFPLLLEEIQRLL